MSGFDRLISRREMLVVLMASLLAAASRPAIADDGGGGSDGGGDGGGSDGGGDSGGSNDGGKNDAGTGEGDGEDRIRDAVKTGDALPLKDILAVVSKKYKGEVVRIRLSGSGGQLVYSIRIIDPGNRLIEVRVNAKSRRIISAGGV